MIDMDFSTGSTADRVGDHGAASTCVCYGSNAAIDIPLNFPAMLWNSYALKFFVVYELKPADRQAAVTELSKLLQAGTLKHAIGPRFPLERIAEAHDAVEAGQVIGNVVLEIRACPIRSGPSSPRKSLLCASGPHVLKMDVAVRFSTSSALGAPRPSASGSA